MSYVRSLSVCVLRLRVCLCAAKTRNGVLYAFVNVVLATVLHWLQISIICPNVGGRLQLVFTRIDYKDQAKPFYFSVKVNEDKSYSGKSDRCHRQCTCLKQTWQVDRIISSFAIVQ